MKNKNDLMKYKDGGSDIKRSSDTEIVVKSCEANSFLAENKSELLSKMYYSKRMDSLDMQPESHFSLKLSSACSNQGTSCFKFQSCISNFLYEMLGNETDFNLAYQQSANTLKNDSSFKTISTRGDETHVKAKEFLCYFPLRFKDSTMEKEYGHLSATLLVGRTFIVYFFLIFVIFPLFWYFFFSCYRSIDLYNLSKSLYISLHVILAGNLLIYILLFFFTIFPSLVPFVTRNIEYICYVLAFLWFVSIILYCSIVAVTIKAPDLISKMMSIIPNEHVKNVSAGSSDLPVTIFKSLIGLDDAKDHSDKKPSSSYGAAGGFAPRKALDITLKQDDTIKYLESFFSEIEALIKFLKLPLYALGAVFFIFCFSLLYLNAMVPSRTKYTFGLHILMIPLAVLPFVLTRIKYSEIVPWEETVFFVLIFLICSISGFVGRYAQEFQHRILFASWRTTKKRLQETNEKLRAQKKKKKASTAIEELISMVKECDSTVQAAKLQGRRGDISYELLAMEEILEKILETLTQTDNLYSVRFAAEDGNEIERQFIEMYNKEQKFKRSNVPRDPLYSITCDVKEVLSQNVSKQFSFYSKASNCFDPNFSFLAHRNSFSGQKKKSCSLTNDSQFKESSKISEKLQNIELPQRTSMLFKQIGIDWGFDVLSLSAQTENILLEVGYVLLCPLVPDWGCEDKKLIHFLHLIQSQYQKNPYHNKSHGAMVAHSVDCLTRMFNAQRSMNSVDKGTLIVAALCHDVGHPGRTNQFFVNGYDPLAIIYNDVAVLENFHSCLTFRALEQSESNIFFFLDEAEFRYIRQNIIECILATDMKQHFESLSRFRVRRLAPDFNYMKNQDDRWLLSRMCMKVADISHAIVNWKQHFEWSCRVVEEFYQQGEEERLRGIPISALCDKEKHSEMAKSQEGFLKIVVKPLIKELAAVEPFQRFKDEIIGNLKYNKNQWKSMAEKSEVILFTHPQSKIRPTVTTTAVRRIAGLEECKHSKKKCKCSRQKSMKRSHTPEDINALYEAESPKNFVSNRNQEFNYLDEGKATWSHLQSKSLPSSVHEGDNANQKLQSRKDKFTANTKFKTMDCMDTKPHLNKSKDKMMLHSLSFLESKYN